MANRSMSTRCSSVKAWSNLSRHESEEILTFSPFAWLDERRHLRRKYGYVDHALRASLKVNEAIKVTFSVPFPSDCYGITCVRYSPVGQLIAAGCADGTVQVLLIQNIS